MSPTCGFVEDSYFNSTNQRYEKKLVRVIKSTPCQQLVHDPHIQKHVQAVVALPGFEKIVVCPDLKASGEGALEDFKISQDLDNNRFRTVCRKVYPCSLDNPADCASHQQLLGLRSDYSKLDRLLKSSDFKDPLAHNSHRGIVNIDVPATKILKKIVRNAKIIDDLNRFGPPSVKLEFSQLVHGDSDFITRDRNQTHCSKDQIYSQGGGGCQEYISFDYSVSSEVEVMRRNYKSFTALLGELGGLLKIFSTAVFFFYSIYNYKKMKGNFAGLILQLDPQILREIHTI